MHKDLMARLASAAKKWRNRAVLGGWNQWREWAEEQRWVAARHFRYDDFYYAISTILVRECEEISDFSLCDLLCQARCLQAAWGSDENAATAALYGL